MAVALLWNCVLFDICEVQISLPIAGSCDRFFFFSCFSFGQMPGNWALFDSYPTSLLTASLTIHLPDVGSSYVPGCPTHGGADRTGGQLCMYIQGSPDESKLLHTGTRSATT